MEVANKNSYSVYALPAILLAGSLIIKLKNLPNVVRAILAICSLIASVTILLSGNRSGWLGVVVVGALLIKDRKFVGLLLVLIFTAAAVLFMTQFGDTTVAERRLMDTQSGRTSDNMRIWLLRTCVQIGLENPLLGVSPQGLPYELGRRYEETTRMNIVDSHNVFGHILGGSGLICFAALMLSGWGIWRFPRANPNFPGPQGLFLRHAAATLHSMIILWVVRGMFSREILYNPGACLGLGLAIGWCIVESTNLTMRNRQPTAAWQ